MGVREHQSLCESRAVTNVFESFGQCFLTFLSASAFCMLGYDEYVQDRCVRTVPLLQMCEARFMKLFRYVLKHLKTSN